MRSDLFCAYSEYLTKLHGEKIWRLPLSTGIPCVNKINGNTGCTFCDDTTFTPQYTREQETIEKQIERGIKFYGERYGVKHYYGFFQSNTNTYGPIDYLLECFEKILSNPIFKGIAISTRPDHITPDIIQKLEILNNKYKKDFWIELGLQSTNDKTLQRINRNHDYNSFKNSVKLIKSKSSIKICAHMIIGLPGESEDMIVETYRTLFDDNQLDGLKLRILDIIEGTPIYNEYHNNPNDFMHFTFESFVNIICNILEFVPPEVVIMRFVNFASLSRILRNEKKPVKDEVLKAVENELLRRGTRQGYKR